jgi:hypothetical protein
MWRIQDNIKPVAVKQLHSKISTQARRPCIVAAYPTVVRVSSAPTASPARTEPTCIALVIDAVFPFWRRPNVKPVEVDDEVLSDIGRSLLALAERRARKAA